MKQFKLKNPTKLKLEIDKEEASDEEYVNTEEDKEEKEINYNKGTSSQDRLVYNKLQEFELIKFYLTSPAKDFDFSYYWIETLDNASHMANPIIINLTNQIIEPPIRDYTKEFDILKLITEDSHHKANLIEVPKALKKLNRYSDILPCKIFYKF